MEKHNKNCTDPFNVKRLCIRDYDDKGRQKFVPYALTCLSCNIIVRDVNFEHKPTDRERNTLSNSKKLDSILGLPPASKEQVERARKHKVIRKYKRRKDKLERKLLGEECISPEENGLRRRIKGFNKLYSYEHDNEMRDIIKWDIELCQKFLDLRPTVKEIRHVLLSSPLHRTTSSTSFRTQKRYIPRKPIPDRPGWYRRDFAKYKELVVQEAETRKKLMNDIIKRDPHDRDRERKHDKKEIARLEAEYLRQQT
jgi:hypothetical protein